MRCLSLTVCLLVRRVIFTVGNYVCCVVRCPLFVVCCALRDVYCVWFALGLLVAVLCAVCVVCCVLFVACCMCLLRVVSFCVFGLGYALFVDGCY